MAVVRLGMVKGALVNRSALGKEGAEALGAVPPLASAVASPPPKCSTLAGNESDPVVGAVGDLKALGATGEAARETGGVARLSSISASTFWAEGGAKVKGSDSIGGSFALLASC